MKLKGSVENIIYRSDINGFTVLSVRSGKTVFTLTGNIASINNVPCGIHTGDVVRFVINWVFNKLKCWVFF